jgi:hypothetical protein
LKCSLVTVLHNKKKCYILENGLGVMGYGV